MTLMLGTVSSGASSRIEGPLNPHHALRPQPDHIKAARRWSCKSPQIVSRRPDDAALLGWGHAGQGAAMVIAAAPPDLDKNQRAVRCTHDQIDFTASAPRRPIMAFQQAQALSLQVARGVTLGRIAPVLGGAGCTTWTV